MKYVWLVQIPSEKPVIWILTRPNVNKESGILITKTELLLNYY